ncbi:MAG: hypothetical protein HY657_01980 [Acidobacteria bacterium]|nr:hypothetical protein [Acidobacteriota bacterium]
MACVMMAPSVLAQGRGGRGGPPPVPRAAAPVDFTGTWVSIVSEDWRWRMITPPKGDYANIPINAAAQKVADGWDPARDLAAGEQCRAYAAPAIMREPGRVRISWQDDYTLKIETDAGMQTRLVRFARPDGAPAPPTTAAPNQRSWQGFSVARWEVLPRAAAGLGLGLGLGPRPGQSRTLEVQTTQIRPGYLRKNGVPFSANAGVTEYYDFFEEPDGADWFVVTTIVTDPQYLSTPWVTTSHFKKEPDDSKWNPQPCQVR